MPKAKRSLDPDAALKLFRQHLARADEILTGHAQRAMAETGGKVRRAARLLGERLKADAAYLAEHRGLDRYRKICLATNERSLATLGKPQTPQAQVPEARQPQIPEVQCAKSLTTSSPES